MNFPASEPHTLRYSKQVYRRRSSLSAVAKPNRPKWMGEVDFSGLNAKLIGTMGALSGIKLLWVFLSIPEDYSSCPGQWTAMDSHLA